MDLVSAILAGAVLSYSDLSNIGAAGSGDIYTPLLAAIDASNPTLDYSCLRGYLAGTWSDGDPVASATEWVSGTYPATQGTASAQPTFVESANGGHPAFRFDGGDWIQATGFTNSQPNTILVVGSWTNIDVSDRIFVDGGGNASKRNVIYSGGGVWRIYGGNVLSDGVDDEYTHVFVATFNGASSALHIDGSLAVSGNTGTLDFQGISIGARYDGFTSLLIGDIQVGPIIWDTPPSQAQIEAIEAELEALGYVTLP